jgi:hypothetical protein
LDEDLTTGISVLVYAMVDCLICYSAGIFAAGFLIFTLLCKIAIPILQESEESVDRESARTEAA